MFEHWVIKCPYCGTWVVQQLNIYKSFKDMVFKCKRESCNRSRKAHYIHQKFAGLMFERQGPFNGIQASVVCRELNGFNKEVGFGIYR